MSSQEPVKLLLVGATGYVGGTLLTTLLQSLNPRIRSLSITALVQNQRQADALINCGLKLVLYSGPGDVQTLTTVAAQNDIVINTEPEFPRQAALDLIGGLAGRGRQTRRQVQYFHLSGTYNLADAAPRREVMIPFSDTRNDIASILENLNSQRPMPTRTTDLAVLRACAGPPVKCFLIMPPEVYGIGTGPIPAASEKVGRLALDAYKEGCPVMVGDGFGEVGHVHVEDLAALYEVLLARVLNNNHVGGGVYFCSGGLHMWRNVAHLIGRIGQGTRVLQNSLPIQLSEREAARRWTRGDMAELRRTFCCSFETKPDRARAMGWVPRKGEEDWGNWVYQSTQSAFGAARNQWIEH